MKYLFLIAVIGMFAIACHKPTKEDRAHAAVAQAVKDSLKDPDSYESVSFSQLLKLKDTVKIVDGQSYPQEYHGEYEIAHTYRSKNAYGGTITKSDVFHLDSGLTTAKGGYLGQHIKFSTQN
ncbi:hypothetical protein [Mucilaginibacter sp. dw_454]|uniref:hypothetical protein n=1 Tax=Mucilaginibacter sp. dw_454 TaxID=2720079 RepID=UPI001BD35117|nr:hypothetical protein [Mucilaginibacter sp. dw_454]